MINLNTYMTILAISSISLIIYSEIYSFLSERNKDAGIFTVLLILGIPSMILGIPFIWVLQFTVLILKWIWSISVENLGCYISNIYTLGSSILTIDFIRWYISKHYLSQIEIISKAFPLSLVLENQTIREYIMSDKSNERLSSLVMFAIALIIVVISIQSLKFKEQVKSNPKVKQITDKLSKYMKDNHPIICDILYLFK